ncbi:hypothetical protein CJ030_MR7G012093 [Morella rubra]|uniref:Uncharacterized protein n=1 Tax=Morella rubra TaxID=262757 RepID=A0A6A1UY83_9ROSI|nr:hypothetical protein CJ030_MR7G012093 [Morella rubra]
MAMTLMVRPYVVAASSHALSCNRYSPISAAEIICLRRDWAERVPGVPNSKVTGAMIVLKKVMSMEGHPRSGLPRWVVGGSAREPRT